MPRPPRPAAGRTAAWPARRAASLVLLAAAALLAAACSSNNQRSQSASATTAVSSTTTAGATTTATGGAPTTTAAPSGQTIQVQVTGGKVQTAQRRVTVRRGQTVRLQVTADVADEVHVHGYDLTRDTTPGTPAVLEFTAELPGVFEVELEQARLKLLELQVQ